VEVYLNGEWGTLSDFGWDLNDAQVVCNELGFGKVIAAVHNALYGEGNSRVWLNGVYCIGTEWSIGNCSHGGWELVSYNSHSNDAGVQCSTGNVMLYIHMYLQCY